MGISLDGQVAIVTGAGRGLGRTHALALAERGAKVVVNDLASASGQSDDAESVAEEIRAAGGDAMTHGANVADFDQVADMTARCIEAWGRVDILVNNAGILRDKSFTKMSIEDFRTVVDVHLMGSVNCTKTVWDIMREQSYGRVIFTSSSSGLYGNFGQSNYGAAKMAVVGLMNTLHLEGAKYNIRVNCLAPGAGTAMTEGLIPETVFRMLTPESVSPGVVFLCGPDAPSRVVLCAAGGSFAVYDGYETTGTNLLPDRLSAEGIADAWQAVTNVQGMQNHQSGFEQISKFSMQASKSLGIDLT